MHYWCVAITVPTAVWSSEHTVEWAFKSAWAFCLFIFFYFSKTSRHFCIFTASSRKYQDLNQARSLLPSPQLCPSPRVLSATQGMNREGKRGKEGADKVTAAPVVHDEVCTPLPCLVSVTPPLALRQSAGWHLWASCTSQRHSFRLLSCWHQDSLLLLL